ncbi:MAG TPA: hypothetical protein VD833_22570 [Vicinamibacterales bacterium]|nr:hypothetical protein [Vicinamibacterales bacterium]
MKADVCGYNPLAVPWVPRARPAVSLSVALTLAASAAGQSAASRTFEDDPPGRPPPGFTFHVVRRASPVAWTVQRDAGNSFLAHPGDPGGRAGFALAVLEGAPRGRVSVSVRIRMAAGTRSAGVVWKVQDPDNYYLARLDLDRQDIGLYRVVKGNRVRIEGEDDLELDRSAWHTLKAVQESENIRVYLGGIRVLRARDRTFEDRGSVGVWCAADATVHFDDLRLDPRSGNADSHRGR